MNYLTISLFGGIFCTKKNRNMELKRMPFDLSVCKLHYVDDIYLSKEFFFLCKTDEEVSLVCKTEDVPSNTTE